MTVNIIIGVCSFLVGMTVHWAKARISESLRGREDRATFDHQHMRAKQSEVIQGLMGLLPAYLKAVATLVEEIGFSNLSMPERLAAVRAAHKPLHDLYFSNAFLLPEPLADQVAGYMRFLNGEVNRFQRMIRDPKGDQSQWGTISDAVCEKGSADLAALEKDFRALAGPSQ